MVRSKAVAVRVLPKDGKPRKPRRWKSKTVAAREIRKCQRSISHLIPSQAVRRVVKDFLRELSTDGNARMTRNAFEMLLAMSSTVMSDTLGAAERVRATENASQSIRASHVRVGRSMIGVRCLSDAQLPIEISLNSRGIVKPVGTKSVAVVKPSV